MTQKASELKEKQDEKNPIPPICHLRSPSTRKGKRIAEAPLEEVSAAAAEVTVSDPIIPGDYMPEEKDVDSHDEICSGETPMDYDDEDGAYSFEYNDVVPDKITDDHEQNCIILSMDDIQQRQEEATREISTVLSVPKDYASILLVHNNWNISNVHEAWFANEEEVRNSVGLMKKPNVQQSNAKEMTCWICFKVCPRDAMRSTACGHLFCCLCWRAYIETSINDGPGCLMLRCPDPSCVSAVTEKLVIELVSNKDKEKYSRYCLRSYVEASKTIKWCPAPGCDYAVEFILGSNSYDVCCKCSYSFCWKCLVDAHRPVDCDTVARWISKNTEESVNLDWLFTNSKPCPKCKRAIEKDQGCMHMTCTPPCYYQFCWLCLGPWSRHGPQTGGFDSCNRYERKKRQEEKKRRAKKHLQKYTHYYERWTTNELSRQQATMDFKKMQTVIIDKLSDGQGELKKHLMFVTDAWLQIIECRRVLKWTYAYGYYLPDNQTGKKHLFEYLQGEAEFGLERLHKCAEEGLNVYLSAKGISDSFNEFRNTLVDLTSVTARFFKNLVQALENGLPDVEPGGVSSTMDSPKGLGRGKKKKGASEKETTSISSGSGHGLAGVDPGGVSGMMESPKGSGRGKKKKGGNGKGTTSTSSGSGDVQEDQGLWSCGLCTYDNNNNAAYCLMCDQLRGS